MSLLQTTSKRGLTHLFSPYATPYYHTGCAKALCGAEVKRKKMGLGLSTPQGKICARCKRQLARITAYYNRVSEVVGGE